MTMSWLTSETLRNSSIEVQCVNASYETRECKQLTPRKWKSNAGF